MDLIFDVLFEALQAIAYEDGSFSVRRLLVFLLIAAAMIAACAYLCGLL